ncbi:alpha/beta hydrolase, partial [Lactobacillus sp. XV13L]|nr:alpha/beta hydrolase [Lactobacillus sp. XV13L]
MTKITTDVVYDHQKNLTVDIYAPTADTAPSKVLVFWHGGGWFRGDKDSLRDL